MALAAPLAATPPTGPPPAASGPASGSAIELLHNVPSLVVVATLVNNKTIRAEHLVDGKLDTAWNSRGGELEDAAIELFVPAGAYVSAIRMTAGYLGQGDTGDLYTQNHRITKVRVLREGELVADFALDPQRRELQPLLISRPGGHFRIEVAATLPGTKERWHEVCVSELEVWGTPPAGVPPRRQEPMVRVGHLLNPEADPVHDLAAYCKQHNTEIAGELMRERTANSPSPGAHTEGPFCTLSTRTDKTAPGIAAAVPTAGSPFGAALLYDTTRSSVNPIGQASWVAWTDLGLRTAKGWYRYPLLEKDDFSSSHCSGSASWTLQEFLGSPRELTARYRFETTHEPMDGGTGSRSQTTFSLSCVPWPGRPPICIERVLAEKQLPYK